MTDYINLSKYDKKDLPSFARQIFSLQGISNETKLEIVNKVLIPYMEDKEFHKSVQGKYIFLLEDKFSGVYIHRKLSRIPVDYPGYKILEVLISDNPPTVDFFSVYQETINVSNGLTIKVDRKIHLDNFIISEKVLIDSGASLTTIPAMNHWNFKTKEYKQISDGYGGRYEFNYSSLNSNIERKNTLEVCTAVGISSYTKITWKEPINISIGDLPTIKIKYMVVPEKYIENLDVIGMDVISKHTMILSSKGMNMDLKIFPSEHIDSSVNLIEKIGKNTNKVFSDVSRMVSNPFKLMDANFNNFSFVYSNIESENRFEKYAISNDFNPKYMHEILDYVKIYNNDIKKSLRVGIIIDDELINKQDFENIE